LEERILSLSKQERPIKYDESLCTGCLICELRCSLRFEKAFNPAKARISIKRQAGGEKEFAIFIAPECDNCGICARNCVYGALTQERSPKNGVME
jgi:ferredoxin